MGNNIVVFWGSPRKDGYSHTVASELIRGVESGGGKVKTYDLNDPGFRGCQGCFHCREHEACIIQDMLQPFYSEVDGVSGIVIASPIYFGDISGQAKKWLDRMFPMLDGKALAPRHPGKRVVSIFAQGDANAERFLPAANRLHGFLHAFGWTVEDTLVCAGSGSDEFTVSQPLMEQAFKAGEKLAGS